MFSLFSKFKEGLKKTTPALLKVFGKVGGIFTSKLSANSIEELEEALYGADFGPQTAEEILGEIRKAYAADKELRGQQAAEIGAKVLMRQMTHAEAREPFLRGRKPEVIVLIGVNGAGKTTTAAKLAWNFSQKGHSVLLGACDTFRAAANEQIKTWAEKLSIELISSQHGADSAAVAFDALQAARSRSKDIVILDTAGRLHNKTNLMKELEKMSRVLKKLDPEAPHHRWLVVDGSLGSNSIEQARAFHEGFGLTGILVTKLDGTSRGGALAGIYRELRLPILFVGLGEKPEDLQPFSAENYVNAIFGIEKA